MLPDFPEVKKKIKKKFLAELETRLRKDELLSLIPNRRIYEGNTMTTITLDGYSDSDPISEIKSGFDISLEEEIEKGPYAVFERIDDVVEGLNSQKTGSIIKKMEEVTERTGNVVDAGGELTSDVYLSTLEKITIDFDEMGYPKMPILIVHPDKEAEIREKYNSWRNDSEFLQKLNEIIKQKWRDWYDRESNRKLVD